jgi:hypothetical protein
MDKHSVEADRGEDTRLPWVRPAIQESEIAAVTDLQPFNGVPTPHDANALQYS